MNYELAKQLKDAGFPQQEPNGFVGILNVDADPNVYFPSLEELIEECGNDFVGLQRYVTSKPEGHEVVYETSDHQFTFKGSTPTEAVARLWLALRATA